MLDNRELTDISVQLDDTATMVNLPRPNLHEDQLKSIVTALAFNPELRQEFDALIKKAGRSHFL